MSLDKDRRDEALFTEAIEGKWRQILTATPMPNAKQEREIYPECPLCAEYNFNGITVSCVGCPIAEETGRTLCYGTPYEEWGQERTFGKALEEVHYLVAFRERIRMRIKEAQGLAKDIQKGYEKIVSKPRPKVKVRLGGPWHRDGCRCEVWADGEYSAFADKYRICGNIVEYSNAPSPWSPSFARGCQDRSGYNIEIRPPRGWSGKLTDIGSPEDVEWAETAGPEWKLPCEEWDGDTYELQLPQYGPLTACKGYRVTNGIIEFNCGDRWLQLGDNPPRPGFLQKIPRGKPLPEGCVWAPGHEPKDELAPLREMLALLQDKCSNMRENLRSFEDRWTTKLECLAIEVGGKK